MILMNRTTITVHFTSPNTLPADVIESLTIFVEENSPVHTCFDNVLYSSYPQLHNYHYYSCTIIRNLLNR